MLISLLTPALNKLLEPAVTWTRSMLRFSFGTTFGTEHLVPAPVPPKVVWNQTPQNLGKNASIKGNFHTQNVQELIVPVSEKEELESQFQFCVPKTAVGTELNGTSATLTWTTVQVQC